MSEQNPRPRTEVTPANEADIQADLRELMIAPNFGAPSDEQRWGLTAQPQGQSIGQPSQAELELQAEIARQQATASALQGLNINQLPQQQTQDEAAHWKTLYGTSENEKGEFRRRLEQVEREKTEKDQILNELLMQMQQGGGMRPGFGPGYQQGAPQGYQQPSYPSYQGYNGPQPVDPFEGKTDDDIFSVRDAKRLVGEAIGPAMQLMQAQTMQQMDRQNAAAKRVALGLTPTEEFMLMRQNPWVNGLSESARIDALASLKASRAQAAQAVQSTATQTQAQVAQTAPIVRRLTTVEQSTQQAPDFTGNALNTAFDRDVAAAKALPEDTGARARAMRAIAEKYGIPVGKMSDMGLMRTQTIV